MCSLFCEKQVVVAGECGDSMAVVLGVLKKHEALEAELPVRARESRTRLRRARNYSRRITCFQAQWRVFFTFSLKSGTNEKTEVIPGRYLLLNVNKLCLYQKCKVSNMSRRGFSLARVSRITVFSFETVDGATYRLMPR
ncbi:hypothetical protein K1T71_013909 [Dendrolimus kikuchii]|uniref:Uncharacterized protein n=1 Tax=Dendrolimus kikuchii TaxID=765133 RepID=A0ACC1CG29_9NEOP|nr:hypothetical protein K1T71_013909 [Dendrolimus kikuchii]